MDMKKASEKKLTIYDIAKELNISIATVSRAFNGKEDVSEETKKKIFETAEKMGYKMSKTASSLSRKKKKIAALFPEYVHEFEYDREVQRGIMKAVDDLSDYHIDVDILVLERNPNKFVEIIQDLYFKGYDGIIVSPPDGEDELSRLLKDINVKNMPIFTITTDLSKESRVLCVQNNNLVAGHLAGELLGLSLETEDKVVLVTGQVKGKKTSQVHRATAEGFTEEIKMHGLDLVGIYEHHDVPTEAYVLPDKILAEHPDVKGIYLATANSETFCKRVIELGYSGKIKIVASDIFEEMLKFIESGTVFATIFQNPFEQGRIATRYLFEYLVERRRFKYSDVLLDPQVILRSNVKLYAQKCLQGKDLEN